ncbi:toll/interleukin-1 receptor domain-containing protein [Clostridium akagii]|uniref:toll/interleukin-1 receptor domain-containing protein n=1 Tax=Clostridium akagii TaxID=91623 RepID=UPI00047B9E34|nr:toll/interleukin-1 receptor domain-containing protein [Clostridium akagii]
MQIFLSYCWKDEERANYIELKCSENYIKLLRDKYDLEDFNSIKKYMEQVKTSDKCILVISEDYMKSENCMYEILQVLESENTKDKVIPIIYYKEIYNTSEIAKWIKYWDNKYHELKENLEKLPENSQESLFEKLQMYKTISLKIGKLISIIVDIYSPEEDTIEKMINNLKVGQKEDSNWNPDLYWFKLDALDADTIEISDYAENPEGEKTYKLISLMIDRDIHGSHCKFNMRDMKTKEVKQLYVNNITRISQNNIFNSNYIKYYMVRKNIDAEKEYLEYMNLYEGTSEYSSIVAKEKMEKIYNTHRCILRNNQHKFG